MGRWQWVAVGWLATILLFIGLGLSYVAVGDQPPSDVVTGTLLLTLCGSWIMLKASAEGGER